MVSIYKIHHCTCSKLACQTKAFNPIARKVQKIHFQNMTNNLLTHKLPILQFFLIFFFLSDRCFSFIDVKYPNL